MSVSWQRRLGAIRASDLARLRKALEARGIKEGAAAIYISPAPLFIEVEVGVVGIGLDGVRITRDGNRVLVVRADSLRAVANGSHTRENPPLPRGGDSAS